MTAKLYDNRACRLGEGPLWHPKRGQFFWFDILEKRLLTVQDGEQRHWQFDDHVSAAGWTGQDTLLIASEVDLFHFDLTSGKSDRICALEDDKPGNRSNDGRADPAGGFWIGTMDKTGRDKSGAFYRYYKGELRKIYDNVQIPNAICFTRNGSHVHFADTNTHRIMRQTLDGKGWPKGEAEVLVDLTDEGLRPDGAVTDSDGNLWNAHYGAGQVAVYDPKGALLATHEIPAINATCPAFGGPDLSTLFCTTASQRLSPEYLADHPEAGQTFQIDTDATGWPEPQVIL